MNTNRGIFDTFPNQAAGGQDSPFSVAHEAESKPTAAKESPFATVERSPFSVVDESAEAKSPEFGKAAKLPERRKADSPFQVAEPSEGFGFEAPAPAPASVAAASPLGAAPAFPTFPPASAAAQAPAASPFSVEPQAAAPAATPAAESAFKPWHESPAPAITPAPQAAAQSFTDDFQSDSSSIRQLELRAIFGVDRELSADEILQRARALPGIRGLARVAAREMATIEGLKNLLPSLGLGGGPLKLYSGSIPLEFIREGPVLLAVQTDGGYAPGVRETLMIIARELGRSA